MIDSRDMGIQWINDEHQLNIVMIGWEWETPVQQETGFSKDQTDSSFSIIEY